MCVLVCEVHVCVMLLFSMRSLENLDPEQV